MTIAGTKLTPTITWATPAAIASGTPLGAAQFNATASVPGTFVYSPAAGTVLPVGAGQPLSVTFTPTDTATYTTAAANVTITVHEGDADDHLADAGGHHLRHGAGRDAAECDGQRAGHVRLHARGRHAAVCRRRPDAVA